MIAWALINAAGCVESAGIGRRPPLGYVPLPPQIDPADSRYLMYADGQWQMRPDLPMVVTSAAGCMIQDCPDGVSATVYDAETTLRLGRVDAEDGLLQVDLPDPGSYRIEIEAPEPYVAPEAFVVTIPEAEV